MPTTKQPAAPPALAALAASIPIAIPAPPTTMTPHPPPPAATALALTLALKLALANQTGGSDGFHFQLARQTALEVNICLMFYGDASNLLISVKGFGIIGGGAVLFSASALAGGQILPLLGETFLDTQLSLAPTQYPCQIHVNP